MSIIGIVSDAHCDHGNAFPKIDSDIDFLVLAGDIGDPYITRSYLKGIGMPYVYIAGNHEFYGSSFEQINSGVFNKGDSCVERKTIEFGGKNFHCCCLWTDLSNPIDKSLYEVRLSDTSQIYKWNGTKANQQFLLSKKFLRDNINEGDIVVTHHAPSFQSVHDKFRGSDINPSFASNLDDMILDTKPSMWICLLYTSPSPRDGLLSRMPSSA